MAHLHFHILLLSIAVAALSPSSAETEPQSVTQICNQTTDFAFCRATIYSVLRDDTADRYDLIDIVSRKAWNHATDTRNFIAPKIKAVGRESQSLQKCLGNYNEAIQKLNEITGNVNSDSYYHLDLLSLDVERNALDCKKVLQRTSIIYHRNEDMLKLANICYVVSKLFPYSD